MSEPETRRRRKPAEDAAEPAPEGQLEPADQADAIYQECADRLLAEERFKRSVTKRITDVLDTAANYLEKTNTEEWKTVSSIATSRRAAARLATRLFRALEAGI